LLVGLARALGKRPAVTPLNQWTEISAVLLALPLLDPEAWLHYWAPAVVAVLVAGRLLATGRVGPVTGLALLAAYLSQSLLAYAPWVGKLNYQPVSLSIAGPLLIAAITPLAALLAAFALALGSGERLEKRMSRPAPSLSIEPGR